MEWSDEQIELPDGSHVPAIPGRYQVESPPDLEQLGVAFDLFIFEYDFPFLIVVGKSLGAIANTERLPIVSQCGTWLEEKVERLGGFVGMDLGYRFNEVLLPGGRQFLQQLVPDFSYVDGRTWSGMSSEEKDTAYLPCVPTVVILLVAGPDTIDQMQEKLAKFIAAGTREGVVVDSRAGQVWIHNRGEEPRMEAMALIEFDAWPEFTLDYTNVRDACTRLGLDWTK